MRRLCRGVISDTTVCESPKAVWHGYKFTVDDVVEGKTDLPYNYTNPLKRPGPNDKVAQYWIEEEVSPETWKRLPNKVHYAGGIGPTGANKKRPKKKK